MNSKKFNLKTNTKICNSDACRLRYYLNTDKIVEKREDEDAEVRLFERFINGGVELPGRGRFLLPDTGEAVGEEGTDEDKETEEEEEEEFAEDDEDDDDDADEYEVLAERFGEESADEGAVEAVEEQRGGERLL